jgi:membrane associated rhomboid family serine protease
MTSCPQSPAAQQSLRLMNLTPPREPILNVPPIVVATLGVMGLVHAARLFLSRQADLEFLLTFAFIPARYEAGILPDGGLPGGSGAQIWTFVTYALIHADLMHLGINAVWLLAFGAPLARRFGPMRFLAFFAVTAMAGAAAHLATHAGELAPMIGASAAVSGAMAAAMRFAFQRGGPIWRSGRDASSYHVPAISLGAALRDPRILAFFAVWFGINLLFGLGSISLTGGDQPIAWQAHVGGFLAGLLLFGFFDPVRGEGSTRNNPPPNTGS